MCFVLLLIEWLKESHRWYVPRVLPRLHPERKVVGRDISTRTLQLQRFTTSFAPKTCEEMMDMGAAGCLLKQNSYEQMIAQLRTVLQVFKLLPR